MSMMGSNSMMEGGQRNYEPLMVQSQYPAGPAMSTFGGAQPFGAAPPSHGGMHGMEASGFGGEGHGGHGGGHDTHGGGEHEGHDEHGGHGGHEQIDKETGMAPRRCTDVQTCFCFLVYAILAFTLVGVAAQHGNRGRLTRGTDYYGRVCGVDNGVENMPFLFWCREDAPSTGVPGSLNLDAPSCVATCPALDNRNPATWAAANKIPCLRRAESKPAQIPGGQFGNENTLLVQVEESLILTAPYPTRARAGRYCIPNMGADKTLENIVLTDSKALGPLSINRILNNIGTLGHLYWLLAATTVFSLGLGYLFIFCIKHCPYGLAKAFLFPLIVLSLLYAVAFTLAIILVIDPSNGFKDFYKPKNPFFQRYEQATAGWLSLGLASVLWVITAGLFGMAWNFKSIGVTDLMNSAFETFRAVPAMMYVPVVEGLAKFTVFWIGLQGFATIASEGWLEKNRIHVNGAKFAGLSREVTPSLHDVRFYLMAVVWIFLTYWMMEFCSACGQFVVSFCTFKYYGMKKEKGKKGSPPPGTVLQGLKHALIYHPGSILRGAILVPWYRPARIINWCTSEINPDEADPSTFGGKVMKCLTCECCPCGVAALCKGIQSSTKATIEDDSCPCKDGYDDVVIRANDFDKGTEKAHELLEHSHKIVQYLYRDHSQTTINLIGVGCIGGLSSVAVYIVVDNLDMFCDPASPLYIAEPILVTTLTFILSAYVAFGFMTLWDHTADTLLYCYAWSRRWNRKTVDQYIPESLRYIVGHDDLDHDRYPYYGKAKNNMYLRYWLPMVGLEDPKKAKKSSGPSKTSKPPQSVMETHAMSGFGMGRRGPQGPPQANGSWMGSLGNFGQGGPGGYPQEGEEMRPLMP